MESSLRVFRDSEYIFVKIALNQKQEMFWCPGVRFKLFWVMRTEMAEQLCKVDEMIDHVK